MSILNMALLFVGLTGTAVFYRDLVANPISAGRAPGALLSTAGGASPRKGAARGFEDVVEHRAGAVLRVGGLGAHRGSGRWAMSAGTESLIRAIQTNDPLAFYGWLHTLKGTPDTDAGVAGDPASLRWASPPSCMPRRSSRTGSGGALCRDDRSAHGRRGQPAGPDWGAVRGATGAHREARTSSDLRSSERRRGLWRRSVPGNAGMVRTPYRGFDEHPPSPLPPSVHQDSATGR